MVCIPGRRILPAWRGRRPKGRGDESVGVRKARPTRPALRTQVRTLTVDGDSFWCEFSKKKFNARRGTFHDQLGRPVSGRRQLSGSAAPKLKGA